MDDYLAKILQDKRIKNFVFLGEAGSGKSTLSINFACRLKKETDSNVDMFDLDMTKPLFRSRDYKMILEKNKINFHYEEQFMDVPTIVGGLEHSLKDKDCFTVLDVGGDSIGARAVGGISKFLGTENSKIFFIINPFRPWSMSLEQIEKTLSEIIKVSRIRFSDIEFVANPNVGGETDAECVITGLNQLAQNLKGAARITFCSLPKDVVINEIGYPIFSLDYIPDYPW